jgi:hypothetical protein
VKQGPTQCQDQADVPFARWANTATAHHLQDRVPRTVCTAEKENSQVMHKQSTTLRVVNVLQVCILKCFWKQISVCFSNHSWQEEVEDSKAAKGGRGGEEG